MVCETVNSIHPAAEREHHDEERKPATGMLLHGDGSVGTPVDPAHIRRERSPASDRLSRLVGRMRRTGAIPQDRHAATVSVLVQTLEDFAER